MQKLTIYGIRMIGHGLKRPLHTLSHRWPGQEMLGYLGEACMSDGLRHLVGKARICFGRVFPFYHLVSKSGERPSRWIGVKEHKSAA